MSDPLCFWPATQIAAKLRAKELSALEVMQAHLRQIERLNPRVNAIVTQIPQEKALAQAQAADEAQAKGQPLGPLHGLPIAHKDLVNTQGIRSTQGSPLFRDFIPEQDDLIVERLKAAGAITIGKTNTPEFGAGSQTFNSVFGATHNPYDLSKTCGGSSGGAAVALACGMIPIADGSDLGGSLRNPANYCNVVGFRPSLGRVAVWPKERAYNSLSVQGPMARTVADVALMLSIIAGPDPRDPQALLEPSSKFVGNLERDFKGVRIAWSQSLGFPVDPQVTAVLENQRRVLGDLGCIVEQTQPDFSEADEVFKTLRAWSFAASYGELVRNHRDQIKDTVIWNVEEGQKLSAAQVARAETLRTTLYHRVRLFMEQYEFLVLPVSQVPPFDITQPYVTEIAGQKMTSYIDWMQSCYFITATGLPAISVPCGFTPEGLPVGVQIVGRLNDDLGVLQLAHAFEGATQVWRRHPVVG